MLREIRSQPVKNSIPSGSAENIGQLDNVSGGRAIRDSERAEMLAVAIP